MHLRRAQGGRLRHSYFILPSYYLQTYFICRRKHIPSTRRSVPARSSGSRRARRTSMARCLARVWATRRALSQTECFTIASYYLHMSFISVAWSRWASLSNVPQTDRQEHALATRAGGLSARQFFHITFIIPSNILHTPPQARSLHARARSRAFAWLAPRATHLHNAICC